MTLTKTHIIDRIYENTGLKRYQSTKVVESFLEIIKKTLEFGEDVLISGFGKFYLKEKSKRKGRNPQNDKYLMPPGRRVVTFGCSGALRKKMNGGGNLQ